MKRCIIIHGSSLNDLEKIKNGAPLQNKRNWIPWIKSQLESKGYEVITPLMPNNHYPDYEEWKNEFEKLVLDEETVLVGHSAGGCFITRWLGENNVKIGKLILVAPAILVGPVPKEIPEEFYDFKINSSITKNAKKIRILISDNDSEGIKKAVSVYSKDLGVSPRIIHGKGHFTDKSMGTNEFPELLEEII